jgi:RES domain-containing protein
MNVWRICKRDRSELWQPPQAEDFQPGRWNHRGIPILYTTHNLSLAALEVFLHLDVGDAPEDLVSVSVEIPDTVKVLKKDPEELPPNWAAYPAPEVLRDIGTDWYRGGESAVLALPSAVVPEEKVYLLNPGHPDFKAVRAVEVRPLRFYL